MCISMLHILVLIHLLTWTIYSRATILYELLYLRSVLIMFEWVSQFFYWPLQRFSLQTRRRCPRAQTYTCPRGCSTYLTHIVHHSLMGIFYHHVHCNKKDKAIQQILIQYWVFKSKRQWRFPASQLCTCHTNTTLVKTGIHNDAI